MSFLSATQTLGPTLVLRRFNVATTPTDGVFVDIAGRPAGLVGWLLTVTGLNAEQSLRVTATEITQHSGTSRDLVPISHVASASTGYSKSIWMLWLGLLLLAYGLYQGVSSDSKIALVIGLVGGGALLAAYWFSRRLKIAVETIGGRIIGLNFKRSVIESVPVDFDRCASVVELLQQLILAAQARRDVRSDVAPQSATSPAIARVRPASGSAATPDDGRPRPLVKARCGKCGAPAEPGSRFCEQCGGIVEA